MFWDPLFNLALPNDPRNFTQQAQDTVPLLQHMFHAKRVYNAPVTDTGWVEADYEVPLSRSDRQRDTRSSFLALLGQDATFPSGDGFASCPFSNFKGLNLSLCSPLLYHVLTMENSPQLRTCDRCGTPIPEACHCRCENCGAEVVCSDK